MMETLQENNPAAGTDVLQDTVPAMSVGRCLREAREQQGLSVEDVVAKIKLAPRQIAALEADDFQSLPETAYLRGFVRSYAKLLQLDAQPLLDALPGAAVAQKIVDPLQVETPFPTARSMRRQNVNLLMAAFVLALVIAGFAIWQSGSPPPAEQERAVAEDALVATTLPLPEQVEIMPGSDMPGFGEIASGVSASGVSSSSATGPAETGKIASGALAAQTAASSVMPVATAKVAVPASKIAAPAGKAASTLRLVFDKAAWAEIKDQSGKTLSKQVNLRGSELRVEGVAPFTLVIGHAASVHLYHQNKPVDLAPYINASSDVARLTLE